MIAGGMFEDAIMCLNVAQEAPGLWAKALVDRALAWLRLGRYTLAWEDISAVITHPKTEVPVIREAAHVALELATALKATDATLAERTLSLVLDERPNDVTNAQTMRAYMLSAAIFEAQRDWSAALNSLRLAALRTSKRKRPDVWKRTQRVALRAAKDRRQPRAKRCTWAKRVLADHTSKSQRSSARKIIAETCPTTRQTRSARQRTASPSRPASTTRQRRRTAKPRQLPTPRRRTATRSDIAKSSAPSRPVKILLQDAMFGLGAGIDAGDNTSHHILLTAELAMSFDALRLSIIGDFAAKALADAPDSSKSAGATVVYGGAIALGYQARHLDRNSKDMRWALEGYLGYAYHTETCYSWVAEPDDTVSCVAERPAESGVLAGIRVLWGTDTAGIGLLLEAGVQPVEGLTVSAGVTMGLVGLSK